ncbi:hypothetical protein D3C78_1792890 [compost metagenome]
MDRMKSFFRNGCIAATGFAVASPSFAAIDTTEVVADIAAAGTSGETVGKAVIAVVAALVVVGVIIALVRKV